MDDRIKMHGVVQVHTVQTRIQMWFELYMLHVRFDMTPDAAGKEADKYLAEVEKRVLADERSFQVVQ